MCLWRFLFGLQRNALNALQCRTWSLLIFLETSKQISSEALRAEIAFATLTCEGFKISRMESLITAGLAYEVSLPGLVSSSLALRPESIWIFCFAFAAAEKLKSNPLPTSRPSVHHVCPPHATDVQLRPTHYADQGSQKFSVHETIKF